MEDITNLITNVGFPIACCVVLFWNNSNFTKTLENIEDKLEDKK